MRFTRSILHMCVVALAFCLGSFAYAATDPVEYGYALKAALADVGAIGADTARFHIEQAYMLSHERMCTVISAGLVKESHGFLQAAADEVAKGTTGSTVSLYS